MAEDNKPPLFNEAVRQRLLGQRIVVLDGTFEDGSVTKLFDGHA